METFEGKLLAGDDRFAIVVSRFNELVTARLLAGAQDLLKRHGLPYDRQTVVWVPGAFELPLAAKWLAESKRYTAIICLGAVIQGETSHHDYINHQVARGILELSLAGDGLPIAFGVLTCESMQQALDRAGGKAGNKGQEAALAALEMATLRRAIQG